MEHLDDKLLELKEIECRSCKEFHQIGTLSAIQTHWYTQPNGCTEGDYWSYGEMQFVCPKNGVINRLLFNNDDVPFDERADFLNNPEKQFRMKYRNLFQEVRDVYDEDNSSNWVNNFYVDSNRELFGIVEKRK